jgi:hypothetical protein
MEAATSRDAGLLTRDGALPVAPSTPTAKGEGPSGSSREAIDGVTSCACCGRHPLVGEQVVHHAAAGRKPTAWVCESCEAAGRARRLGPPDGRVRVRSFGGAMNVRRAL